MLGKTHVKPTKDIAPFESGVVACKDIASFESGGVACAGKMTYSRSSTSL
jgi:hypothetical protein